MGCGYNKRRLNLKEIAENKKSFYSEIRNFSSPNESLSQKTSAFFGPKLRVLYETINAKAGSVGRF
ncbi:hypothetical protein LEP1GSC060_1704 [Leptospira weilii serovar Ranarum str. ICFT]|uniref:Uncharacterized protein n=1 Tax=Leptospira weilii serovar Ranarum str. ICFT TaxID=1218598 RepID=N1WQP4_9LEPT|nr:hypothetical protein LEP1GSC060_1704 [Leptospira weilii serovar Ranarum str. ICFT]